MSMFTEITLACPACGAEMPFKAVRSVNADRRSDLRAAILDESFQRTTCGLCGIVFRLDPDFAYINADRGQWIAARPLARLADWKQQEAEARDAFDRVYGSGAPPGVQAIGRQVVARITFGWAALREKLVIQAHGLDDVAVELAKAAVLRASGEVPIAGNELRLAGVDGDDRSLVFARLHSADEAEVSMKRLPRAAYDGVVTDADAGWRELRQRLDVGLFVDLGRLMLADR
jgi:hypothetical protein